MNTRRILIIVLAFAGLASTTAAVSYRARYQGSRVRMDNEVKSDRVVAQYLSLEPVKLPSLISPYWLARATERFEDAPIRIVYYGDPLCSDCRVLFEQLQLLEKEFAGQLNIAYQFFPLEARCNDVVEKDIHPGACDLSYMMAARPQSFRALHDEILSHLDSAKTAPWRARFAEKHDLAGALADSALQARVHALIRTGAEYAPTSPKYKNGIRSTPTLIVNERMIIGTLPLPQLRAIFQALVYASQAEQGNFIESWINPGCSIASEATQCGSE
jgi:protein-disulfide isomerase